MTVSILALHCLNAVCDDYENIPSIRDEVRRSTHAKVSDEEIGECLMELSKQALVDVFEFDSTESKYVRVEGWVNECNGKWFFITPRGRSELDLNWFEEQ